MEQEFLSEGKGVKQSELVSERDDGGESGMMEMADGRGEDNAGRKKSRGCEISGPYGRQEGRSQSKPWTRLTSLIDEEMPKCIWEPLFALLPTDTDTEWDHLSQESLLSLPH